MYKVLAVKRIAREAIKMYRQSMNFKYSTLNRPHQKGLDLMKIVGIEKLSPHQGKYCSNPNKKVWLSKAAAINCEIAQSGIEEQWDDETIWIFDQL